MEEKVTVAEFMMELMQDETFFPDPELRAMIVGLAIGMLSSY